MMSDDFILTVVANIPNFVGLVYLAYVLQGMITRLTQQAEKQDERYDRLVEALIKSNAIRRADIQGDDTQDMPVVKRNPRDLY